MHRRRGSCCWWSRGSPRRRYWKSHADRTVGSSPARPPPRKLHASEKRAGAIHGIDKSLKGAPESPPTRAGRRSRSARLKLHRVRSLALVPLAEQDSYRMIDEVGGGDVSQPIAVEIEDRERERLRAHRPVSRRLKRSITFPVKHRHGPSQEIGRNRVQPAVPVQVPQGNVNGRRQRSDHGGGEPCSA